jgi:branched-chain amino acid transport system substrate-binding protein
MRWFSLFLVLLMAPAVAAAREPITIGLSLGLTGKYSEMSRMQQRGYRLWQDHLNGSGGLLGARVEIRIVDDESDPGRSAEIYRRLILQDKVDLVFGPYASSITAEAAAVAEQYRYPLLAAGASADSLWEKGRRFTFGVYTPANAYAVGFLEMLIRHGITDIAVAAADDTFSSSIAAGTRTWARRFGFAIKEIRTFPKGTRDLVPLATSLRASGARAVIVCGHFNEALDMRRAMIRIEWRPSAYFASVGPVLPAYGDTLGPRADGTFSSSQWEMRTADKFPGGERFVNDFTATYRMPPSYHAASAYAAGQILCKAVRQVGMIDREKIRDVLQNLDTMTIIGRYGVDRTGLQIRHFPLIIQWQEGEKEVVWPKEFMTAAPRME